jgi:hypothetical protein
MTYHSSCSTNEQLEEIVSNMYSEILSGKSIEGLLQKYFSNLTHREITSLAFTVKDIINSIHHRNYKIKRIVLEIESINMIHNKCSKMSSENYDGNMSNVPSNIFSNTQSNVPSNIFSNVPSNILSNKQSNILSNKQSNTPSNVLSNTPSNVLSNTPSNVLSNTPSNVQKIKESILVPLVKDMLLELKSKKVSVEDLLNTYLPSSLSGEFGTLSNRIKLILNSSNSVDKTVKDIVLEIEKVMMGNGSSSGNVPASSGSVEQIVMNMLTELQTGGVNVQDLLIKYLPLSLTQYVGMLSAKIKAILNSDSSMENKFKIIVSEIKNVMGGNVPASSSGGNVEQMVMKMLNELQNGGITVEDLLMKYLPSSLTRYGGILSYKIKEILKSGDSMENKFKSIVSAIKNVMVMEENVQKSSNGDILYSLEYMVMNMVMSMIGELQNGGVTVEDLLIKYLNKLINNLIEQEIYMLSNKIKNSLNNDTLSFEQKYNEIVSEVLQLLHVKKNNIQNHVNNNNNNHVKENYDKEKSNDECYDCNEYLALGNAYKKKNLYSL